MTTAWIAADPLPDRTHTTTHTRTHKPKIHSVFDGPHIAITRKMCTKPREQVREMRTATTTSQNERLNVVPAFYVESPGSVGRVGLCPIPRHAALIGGGASSGRRAYQTQRPRLHPR